MPYSILQNTWLNNVENFKIVHFLDNKTTLEVPDKLEHNMCEDLKQRWNRHEKEGNTYIKELLKNLQENTIIVEAGGHIGDTTFLMSKHLKSLGKNIIIYVFEPSLDKCNFIKAIIKANNITNVKVVNAALSNEKNKGKLDTRRHSGAWQVEDGNDFDIITLDSFSFPKPISFIKLNVEDFELKALQGGADIIKKYRPILCVENAHKEIEDFLSSIYTKDRTIHMDTFFKIKDTN